MGDRPAESDALLTWFRKQRRQWWRVNWWMLVLILILWLLTPFGLTAVMTLSRPVSLMVYQGGGTHWLSSLVWVNLLIPLASAWMVARLGAAYSLPEDLVLASSPTECNRAFAAALRLDAYMILVLFTLMPFPLLRALAHEVDPGGIFIFALTMGGMAVLLSELSIYLRVARRRSHLLFHTFVPVVIVAGGYFLLFSLVRLLIKAMLDVELTDSFGSIVAIPLISLVSIAAAWVLYRSSRVHADHDSWRDN